MHLFNTDRVEALMAGIATLTFAADAIFRDKQHFELRMVAAVGALLGAISLLTRPIALWDDVVVGGYLLARLQPYNRLEESRVIQILLLLISAIVAVSSHNLIFIEMLLLLAHTGLTSVELIIRLGHEKEA
jgi:hypothetical protein